MLVFPVSIVKPLQTYFSVLYQPTPPFKYNFAWVRRQLDVRFLSRWYYTLTGVGVLAKKNRLLLNLHLK